jgi:hypothetical protein
MNNPELISYKGKTILYLDFSDMKKVDEIKTRLDEGCEYIRKQSPNSVLTLTNTENMFFNNEVRKHFEDKVKGNEPYVKAGAIVGMTGLISIMYAAFVRITGRNLKLFKTKDEALEYLVSN